MSGHGAMSEIRCLPGSRACWERDADVVVVGSGAAGMAAALAAARRGRRVLLLSKQDLGGGATPLAQGGLAAAIGPGDSPALHHLDTLEAGAGLCDPDAVAALVSEAPAETARLVVRGARLEREALHLEGGHSRSRIVTAGGDAIGAEVHRVLRAALLASQVQILTRCVVLDALTGDDGRVGGVLAGICDDDGLLRAGTVTARAVVLATGGFGQAYATTTNPAGVTGDGLALAARAGAELQDLEFVQFHPTVLWQPSARGQLPLITEAVRGAGAILVDAAGRSVMAGSHPLGDLAPRDVVAAAMAERMHGDEPADHLWLDATGLGAAVLERQFPTVTAACRARGIDPVTEPIPVAPGAHYACGGIRAGLDGRTSLPGLYAVGEAASTGVHGANRLASNSLTEAMITGRRVGELLGRELPRRAGGLQPPPAGPGADPACRSPLAAAMSRYAGVLRDRDGLEYLRAALAGAAVASQRAPGGALDLATAEATSLHTVSVLITAAALARAESRGCHRWRAQPQATPAGPARHTVIRVEAGQPEVAGVGQPEAAGVGQPEAAGVGQLVPARADWAVPAGADEPVPAWAEEPVPAGAEEPVPAGAVRATAGPGPYPTDNSNRKASA
jgi:L-aspartate oxidase